MIFVPSLYHSNTCAYPNPHITHRSYFALRLPSSFVFVYSFFHLSTSDINPYKLILASRTQLLTRRHPPVILYALLMTQVCTAHLPPRITVNAPVRTEDPDNQTNDIAKGVLSTGRDVRTVRFVFVSICCGVASLTNPRIFQHTP
jgi:hypothetical protein